MPILPLMHKWGKLSSILGKKSNEERRSACNAADEERARNSIIAYPQNVVVKEATVLNSTGSTKKCQQRYIFSRTSVII